MKDHPPFQRKKFSGSSEGPNLLITAGVHGDEYYPMLALETLVRLFESGTIPAGNLKGSVTIIPIVNPPAFRRGHRCGDDQLDLARTCPGREDGSETELIAHHLSQEIRKADFYVDLHTGGTELCILPLTGYVLHPDETILAKQRKLAKAFQLPFVWGTSAELEGRSLSVARDAGVPAIYIEYLGAHREFSEIMERPNDVLEPNHPIVAGCINVMRHLGILDEPEKQDATLEVIEDWRPQSGHMQVSCPAPATGFLNARTSLGDSVSVGDLIAEIDPGMGQAVESLLSEQNGRLLVLRDYPRINQGDTVAVIAENFAKP